MNPLTTALLERLGLRHESPTRDYLTRVHRAFVAGVTYDTIGIQLGDPPPLDPEAAARRVLSGRVGYCFGMNGALWWLLRELCFDVTLHAGVVRRPVDPEPGVNHLTLVVHLADGNLLADAGMGDGLFEPLPLAEGEYAQGPFTFGLHPNGAGWRFVHDPRGSFACMDFEPDVIGFDALEGPHAHLSTSPESGFVQALVLLRRRAEGIDILRSRTLYRSDRDGRSKRVLTDADDLRKVMGSVFEVEVDDSELQVLWQRAEQQHQAFLDARH
ncbi:MAG: arylamine N-acetyltransferase [Dermatophilus congolensis]|nr:arylamine N-acetyltransferase [Dermatophilus congolensis]